VSAPLVSVTAVTMIVVSVLVFAAAVLGIVRLILGARKENDVRDTH